MPQCRRPVLVHHGGRQALSAKLYAPGESKYTVVRALEAASPRIHTSPIEFTKKEGETAVVLEWKEAPLGVSRGIKDKSQTDSDSYAFRLRN